ncbi:proliferating cell nuclear antigen PCNA, putative [Cryptosporidium muris RN66]|uniref:DNA sliding clamp PCNA n=1 Tax=Cryptosporidium muris (strain RN66) TaxID=441375 RepID=B6AIS1_CRYMR|nr:proliferating cell nuclear antigen PCNA, putative [Cryptosporidium muris RN66]EEA08112.1 proliferating cell nuclear antigen PCNA, putative [Cryptosporidium muris RN66]|eukprot:XP_002142461.1 proliferating cell nuclear antigen PCNA [Cryptosporidium muris RN66]
MFEARLQSAILFKKITEALKELCHDINIECDSEGLHLQAMDSSHIALVCLCISPEAFEHYRCDRPVVLGLSMQQLSKFMKFCDKDTSMLLKKYDDDEDNKITLCFEDNMNTISLKECTLRLMDIEQEHISIPEEDYECNVTMPANILQSIVRDMSAIGDEVNIEISGKCVKFSVDGDDGKVDLNFPVNDSPDETKAVQIHANNVISHRYALRYFSYFTKATPLSTTVMMSISQGVPLRLQFPLNDRSDQGKVEFYLAPKLR